MVSFSKEGDDIYFDLPRFHNVRNNFMIILCTYPTCLAECRISKRVHIDDTRGGYRFIVLVSNRTLVER